jgi:hypothetical protein
LRRSPFAITRLISVGMSCNARIALKLAAFSGGGPSDPSSGSFHPFQNNPLCLSESVSRLLRLWSRKEQGVRLPADADASRVAERRPACRGIR